jgi:hypothetical protein
MTRTGLALLVTFFFGLSCRTGPWTELDSIDQLKETFNRDQGHARLVLLLSPT